MRSTFFITVRKNKDLIIEENAHKKLAQISPYNYYNKRIYHTGNVCFFHFDTN
jgi:hypothetical protein